MSEKKGRSRIDELRPFRYSWRTYLQVFNMSKAVDFISIVNIPLATHDKEDMAKLGTFMLALSRTDLEKMGVHGGGIVRYHHQDYIAVFDGGVVVGRPTFASALLLRRSQCPECLQTSWSAEKTAQYCSTKCWGKMNCEEGAA